MMNMNALKEKETKNTKEVSSKKAISMYIIVSLFLFFEMAVQVSPSVMSSSLMNDLEIGTFGLGVMSSVYFYSYTAMQVPSGLLLDKYNPRFIIVLSILVCSLGSLLFGLSTDIYTGSLARLLMGAGSAFAFVSVLVVTADLFKAKHFAVMTGITQMLGAFGAMSGQMPIGELVSSIGWRNTLFVLSLTGLILSAAVWYFLKYKKIFQTFSSLETASANQENKNSAFGHWFQIKANLNIIFSNPQSLWVAVYACLLWAPMSGFASLWGVPFLMQTDHLSAQHAAFLCSLMWLGLALVSPLLGIISDGFKNRKYVLAWSALTGAISFGLILTLKLPDIIVGLLLFMAGAACSGQALSFTTVKENNNVSIRATAIAFNNMAVVISGAIFQPLIGFILHKSHISFSFALLPLLFAYIIAFVLALFLIKESFGKSGKS